MKLLILILSMSLCVSAKNVVPTHRTTYHDTTITTQLSYIETENGTIEERSTHLEITAPRREQRVRKQRRETTGRGKMVLRGLTLITGCAMIGVSVVSISKSQEYKDDKQVKMSTIGYNNEYDNQIEKYDRRAGIALSIGAGAFALFGVTFLF